MPRREDTKDDYARGFEAGVHAAIAKTKTLAEAHEAERLRLVHRQGTEEEQWSEEGARDALRVASTRLIALLSWQPDSIPEDRNREHLLSIAGGKRFRGI